MGDARIDRIEAILRDHQMHEPNCPVRRAARSRLGTRGPIVCDCWLSKPDPVLCDYCAEMGVTQEVDPDGACPIHRVQR